MVNGTMHMANVSDPQIPAALAPVVRGVAHLNDFRPHSQAHRLGTFRRSKDTGETKPLFTFNACGSGPTPLPCYGVGPGDFAKIYSAPATINSALPGAGVTIAIVQDSNININDVTQFRSLFGLPPTFTSANIILNGPDPGVQGPDSATDDEIEADLDVQWAGAVAPGATVDLVVSEDSESVGMFGTDLSAIYIVDNNFAPILSESFGACEASIGASAEAIYVDLWQQAAAQGISAILSAGDTGSAGCDPSSTASNQDVATQGIAVSGLASTAYNVAMGGTDFQNFPGAQNAGGSTSTFWNATNGSNGSLTETSAKGYIPEWPWNDSCAATATTGSLGTCTATVINRDNANPNLVGIDIVAASGGPSTLNPKPTYQANITGMPTANFRQLPDISLFSGNGNNGSFYVICQQDANSSQGGNNSSCNLTNDNFSAWGVGGTSAAAPAFAGIMAMVNQKTGQRQGNPNYVLYQLYKNGSASTICASAASPAGTCIFYDTVAGNNSVACAGGSPNCSNATTGQFGVLIDPTHTSNPAFITSPGYDNATGLGSVNVTNLVNNWSTVGFTGDTVSLTGPSGSVPHGIPQTFHVSINPAGATGSVALVATPPTGTPVAIGSFSENSAITLNSGVATITTDLLPGGVGVQVVAKYGGDGTFAAGTSTPVTLTVTPETSSTQVGFVTFPGNNPSVSHAAASVMLAASHHMLQIAVSSSNGQCHDVVIACPTGTVTLTDGGKPLNDFSGKNSSTLNRQGIAEDKPDQLAAERMASLPPIPATTASPPARQARSRSPSPPRRPR